LIATPSFSPEFGNNPGYSTFEVQNGKISNLSFTYLNLSLSYGNNPKLKFTTIWAEWDLGLWEITPTSI